VTGMSPGSSMRWGGGEATVGISGESPAALMDHPMMGPTEQGQIGQVGRGPRRPAGRCRRPRWPARPVEEDAQSNMCSSPWDGPINPPQRKHQTQIVDNESVGPCRRASQVKWPEAPS
jgi:hypothetical protein